MANQSNKQRIYTIITIFALGFMTVFMIVFASRQSFWVDELDWMIGIITGKAIFNDKLFTGMFQILLEQGYNLPLYYIIEKPFYYLLPYGEVFLLLPSIAFVIIGIVILGKAGKLIGGIDLGFITVCIAVSSAILITQGGWEIRPYSITFCFSSLVLLMYTKRLNTETNKNIFLYGVSLILLLYCHWFGSILALCYAVTDLCLYIRKKIALTCIFAYILAGICFIPWFALMIFYHVQDLSTYWSNAPRIIEPVLTIAYLLSNTMVYCVLFGIGFMVILLKYLGKNKTETVTLPNIWLFINISIVLVIIPILIYSKYINQTGAFYVQRYFFVIMPQVFLITAYGFMETGSFMQRRFFKTENRKKWLYSIVILLFCFTGFQNYKKAYLQINTIHEPYREAAEYISNEKQVYADGSLVIDNGGSAWIEYYFNKRGFPIPAHVAVSPGLILRDINKKSMQLEPYIIRLFIDKGNYIQPIPLSEEQVLQYDTLYLFEVHGFFPEEFINMIERNYVLIDTVSALSPPTPKQSFIGKTIRSMLHIPLKDSPRPFGLRVYAKNV